MAAGIAATERTLAPPVQAREKTLRTKGPAV